MGYSGSGPQGPAGADGADGAVGPTGPAGATGADGSPAYLYTTSFVLSGGEGGFNHASLTETTKFFYGRTHANPNENSGTLYFSFSTGQCICHSTNALDDSRVNVYISAWS